MPDRVHQFFAVAFEENFVLRQIAPFFSGARVNPLELYLPIDSVGGLYIYPFGALVTHDLAPERRDAQMAALRAAQPRLTAQVVREEYSVVENSAMPIGIVDGVLHVDRFTQARAAIVALTIAQSAAMEYYERIVEDLFARSLTLIERLERRGSVPFRTRPLHRFIGEGFTTRSEVLSVLHLLDKPEAAWEDTAMDRTYEDLRAEFDLPSRYEAIEAKLQSIQEALVLVLDVARDRRMLLLEIAIAILILIELVVSLPRLW